MYFLDLIIIIFLVMAAVYVIFNLSDFLLTWYGWAKLLGIGIWKGIKYLWRLMTGWIGRK